MQTVKQAPEHWSKMPIWFKENEWLIENQEHIFVQRLCGTIAQIKGDMSERGLSDKPMDATKRFLGGEEATEATQFQYSETIKEVNKLVGVELKKAEELLLKFKEEFSEYIPFLEGVTI